MPSSDILGIQQALERGEATSVRLLESCVNRIDKVDRGEDGLRAVLEVNPDAMSEAEAMDEARAQGDILGPLHGIPVLLKANIETADRTETTAGSLAMQGYVAERDAFLVSRLRASGAVILGKANLSEWANFRGTRSVSGWSSLGGQTRNPYDSSRSPCGSSSGSAAAVAAGLCAVSVGTETDGSIVCPAQTCGVVGIKPTVGLVSRSGIIPIAHSQDTAGPMARNVKDAAFLLSALAGTDPKDPATAAIPSGFDYEFSRHCQGMDLRGLRLGVVRDCFGRHPRVDALIERRLSVLKDLGAELVDPANLATAGQWRTTEMEVLLHEFKHDLNAYLAGISAPMRSLADVIEFNRRHAETVMPYFGQELMEQAQAKGDLTDSAYLDALATNRRLTRDEGIDATLQTRKLDALVAPTGTPAWLIDHILGDFVLGGCSSAAAVAGYPHITVPAGFIKGLPVGLSFFAGAWQEPILIRVAYAFEQAIAGDMPQQIPIAKL
jgi:amidase